MGIRADGAPINILGIAVMRRKGIWKMPAVTFPGKIQECKATISVGFKFP